MANATKAKIEDIYPLSFMQRALLMHSLYEEEDQGIIRTSFELIGPLNQPAFEQAWQKVVQRHPALRSSVHWEKVEKPVQVVRPDAKLRIEFRANLAESEQEEQIAALDLTKAPVGRFVISPISENRHYFQWDSHHILLDGWSAGIILRDVFTYYEAFCRDSDLPQLPPIPNYRNYLSWFKTQDQERAEIYWRKRLNSYEPQLFPELPMGSRIVYQEYQQSFSTADLADLQAYCREERLTLNSLFQGLWSLLLYRQFGQTDIVFGTTRSGRTSEIPNMDHMAGLFAKVLPVRTKLIEGQSLNDWLQEIQGNNLSASSFEFVELDQVLSWADLQTAKGLFNSLLVVQNYPWDELSGGELSVANYQGDLTTTYPLSAMLIPGEGLQFILRYQEEVFPTTAIDWLVINFKFLLDRLLSRTIESVSDLLAELPTPPDLNAIQEPLEHTANSFEVATTPTELQLTQIWEKLLGRSPVGVSDDFFALGGTSLQAIRLFSQIQKQFDKNLPPISLLQNRTIRQLAKLIHAEESAVWTTVVPLKASGQKTPLYCLHAGMGHVFFYQALSESIDKDRPIYAIQPEGMSGDSSFMGSISEMATHYLQEIRKVQTEPPYYFLAYCFSTAVCLEMGKQLIEQGLAPPTIFVVDSSPRPHELYQSVTTRKDNHSAKWLLKRLLSLRWRELANELSVQFAPKAWLSVEQLEDRANRAIRASLVPAFEDYIWSKYPGKIVLIRSQEFMDTPFKNYHLKVWNELSNGTLDIEEVPGKHADIFSQPAVTTLADIIDRQFQGQ